MKPDFSLEALYQFIVAAGKNTYAGGGKYEEKPERSGFHELIYEKGDWHYRDSYTGFLKSHGSEIVRYQAKPVWAASYGGGMLGEDKELARKTFKFLKQALSSGSHGWPTFRGPNYMQIGKFEYIYEQEGDVTGFTGTEMIRMEKQTVFTHRILGGLII